MLVGVLRERDEVETRVAATPASVGKLIDLGYEVIVEPNAGAKADFSDEQYMRAGASVGDPTTGAVLLAVNPPDPLLVKKLRRGTTVIALFEPQRGDDSYVGYRESGLTAISPDAVPRLSRAQGMDVLSSMANLAGYRAVIESAHLLGRPMGGQVTAAGRIAPATVLVAGAGVAGLAAVGTAVRLGARVFATDPRPEVGEQVRSLGGEFLHVASTAPGATETGHAVEMTADYRASAADLYAEQCPKVDVLITTAQIPGKPAPLLVTAPMLASMRAGSVVMDLAADSGGNVEGVVSGQSTRTASGVTLVGASHLARAMPAQSSSLYATNLLNLLQLLTPAGDGELQIDLADPIQRAVVLVMAGEVLWPPPATSVRVPDSVSQRAEKVPAPPKQQGGEGGHRVPAALAGGSLIAFAAAALSPPPLRAHLTVFALSVVVGFFVIGKVHHALHTPLMSVTNAISGVVVVAALLQVTGDISAVTWIAGAAVLLASVNIFGGFAVTGRMLAMFIRS